MNRVFIGICQIFSEELHRDRPEQDDVLTEYVENEKIGPDEQNDLLFFIQKQIAVTVTPSEWHSYLESRSTVLELCREISNRLPVLQSDIEKLSFILRGSEHDVDNSFVEREILHTLKRNEIETIWNRVRWLSEGRIPDLSFSKIRRGHVYTFALVTTLLWLLCAISIFELGATSKLQTWLLLIVPIAIVVIGISLWFWLGSNPKLPKAIVKFRDILNYIP